MKKRTVAFVLCLMLGVGALAGCGNASPDEDVSKEPATEQGSALGEKTDSTETASKTDTKKKVEKSTKEKSASNSGEIRPEMKKAMDSYEEFMDEYCEFMEKYSESDDTTELMSDYADYMAKYADFSKDFEAWEDSDMNEAEENYYIEVQLRVNEKLAKTAGAIA